MSKFITLIFILLTGVSVIAQDVVPVWVNTFNSSGTDVNFGNAIDVDINGNVYVGGQVTGAAFDDNAFVIKYLAGGDSAWADDYDGSGGMVDVILDIEVKAGFVYVTGISGGNYNYLTMKYDTVGNRLWDRTYNGPGGGTDIGWAVAVDDGGNAYVTGMTWDPVLTSFDFATLKYLPNGDTDWVAIYEGLGDGDDRAYDIGYDAFGGIYVVGPCADSIATSDFFIVKYNTAGTFQWKDYFDGSNTGQDDTACAVAVTANGDIYVTGTSYITGTGYDYTTIKYDRFGVRQWVRTYDGGSAGFDGACDIILDQDENVIITGESYDSGTGADMLTVKYDSTGVFQWASRYTSPGDSADKARALDVDSYGNIYVVGYGAFAGEGRNIITVKYKPNGDTAWTQIHDGPSSDNDYSTDIAVDISGNTFITGNQNSPTSSDIVTIRYSFLGPLIITAFSPVNLWVTDPIGNYIGKDALGNLSQTIYPADYIEEAPDYIDIVHIYYPIEGEYIIEVIPEDDAPPGSTYAIGIQIDGSNVCIIADEVDVPTEGSTDTYIYTVDETYHYLNGDADRNDAINILDITFLISFLYKDGPDPYPEGAGDADCNLTVNILDITYLISYLYKDGPPPCNVAE